MMNDEDPDGGGDSCRCSHFLVVVIVTEKEKPGAKFAVFLTCFLLVDRRVKYQKSKVPTK
jgi:hypothetical protein